MDQRGKIRPERAVIYPRLPSFPKPAYRLPPLTNFDPSRKSFASKKKT